MLGRAIQPPQVNGAGRTQLLEKGKLIYDPTANIQKYFTLAPLGVQLGLGDHPAQPVKGYSIAPEFVAAYERLGPLTAGQPIGEARYDSYYGRQEQNFENLGFYRQEGTSEVHLLNYGVASCQCPDTLPPSLPETGAIDAYYPVDPTFAPFVEQLGADFTGSPISEAYLNLEGRWEQIFRNVTLIASAPGNAPSVQLRPLTREIRLPVDPPRRASGVPDDHFYSTGSGLGYDIPGYFWDYLADHGGLEMTGAPVTHLAPLNGRVLHQCFTNLCLMFDLNASSSRRVYPEPLGRSYRILNYQKMRASSPTTETAAVRLMVWEAYPVLAFDQRQEIGVSVYENDQPALGLTPTLRLTLPGGIQKEQTFPPTATDGISALKIDPFEASNGDRVLYKVCLNLPDGGQTCTGGSFVIWNNP